ncbi:MAG: hypothetical protein K0S04_861 [Herbinix sp.]|jgi:hypothetical protein|nr:hypothetical protein [Herbinix sp.]
MTYTYCKKIIESSCYVKEDMLDKLEIFLLNKRINQQQYNELIGMMA